MLTFIALIATSQAARGSSNVVVPPGQGSVQAQNGVLAQNPDRLVSEMLARYVSAKSLKGTARLTQKAMGQSLVIESQFAFSQPGKLMITQQKPSSGQVIGAKSDGNVFVYSPPSTVTMAPPLVRESVKKPDGSVLSVQDMYMIQRLGLLDRSPAFMILFGVRTEIRYFANQLVALRYVGTDLLGGNKVHVIRCKWRETPDEIPSGEVELILSEERDLLRYTLVQTFGVPNQTMPDLSTTVTGVTRGGKNPIPQQNPKQKVQAASVVNKVTVTSVWDVQAQINADVSETVFSLKSGN